MSLPTSYARALYEAARETKLSSADIEALERSLDGLIQVVSHSKEAQVALYGPATSAKEKAAIIGEITQRAQAPELLRRFATLLAQKERLVHLPEIREAFTQIRIDAEGGVMGKIVSADPMDQSDVEGLAKAFSQKLGKRVAFRLATDPNLLAGMKVTVNGVTYDGTLRTQLQRLRDRLLVNTETVH